MDKLGSMDFLLFTCDYLCLRICKYWKHLNSISVVCNHCVMTVPATLMIIKLHHMRRLKNISLLSHGVVNETHMFTISATLWGLLHLWRQWSASAHSLEMSVSVISTELSYTSYTLLTHNVMVAFYIYDSVLLIYSIFTFISYIWRPMKPNTKELYTVLTRSKNVLDSPSASSHRPVGGGCAALGSSASHCPPWWMCSMRNGPVPGALLTSFSGLNSILHHTFLYFQSKSVFTRL